MIQPKGDQPDVTETLLLQGILENLVQGGVTVEKVTGDSRLKLLFFFINLFCLYAIIIESNLYDVTQHLVDLVLPRLSLLHDHRAMIVDNRLCTHPIAWVLPK